MKFLIVGLGNIGDEYQQTRHNIGFEVVEELVQKHNGQFKTDRLAAVADIKIRGKVVTCIKPSTYMNLSGRAVKYWADKLSIQPENMIVVVDELALPLSKIRIKPSGSPGGHNGLKSISEVLGSDEYPRLRFGIGNNYPRGKQADFVLGRWTDNEWPLVRLKAAKAVEALETYVVQGLVAAMNEVNNKEYSL